jgi:hypothetical protein
VDCTARTYEEISLVPQLTDRRANFYMVMRIVTRVQRDNCGGWACFGKHAYEDKIHVVNPLKRVIPAHIEPGICQQFDASVVRPEIIV